MQIFYSYCFLLAKLCKLDSYNYFQQHFCLLSLAYNIFHAGKSDDSAALFIIGLGWCGMLAALAYTAYKDYKRGY
jgi:succinate-acetate transporter protein